MNTKILVNARGKIECKKCGKEDFSSTFMYWAKGIGFTKERDMFSEKIIEYCDLCGKQNQIITLNYFDIYNQVTT